MHNRYPMVDIAKLFCSLLVVLIHVYEIRGSSLIGDTIVYSVAQQAVPFFFMVSGFFINDKLNNREYIKKYLLHLLLVYGIWVVIWLPSIIKIYANRSTSTIQMVILIIRRVLFSGYGVYWYLLVLAETVLIIWFFRNRLKALIPVAFVGLALCYVYDLNLIAPVKTAFYYVFSWSNNVIMNGLPFTIIGIMVKRHLQYHTINRSILLLSYGVINIIDIILFHMTGYAILSLLEAFFLLLLSIQLWHFPCNTTRLRNISSVFYLIHTIIIYLIIDPLLGVDGSLWVRFIIVVFLASISYIVIVKINNKWINHLMLISVKQ